MLEFFMFLEDLTSLVSVSLVLGWTIGHVWIKVLG